MHRLEQTRLAELLERVAPAVLVAHSAGGPGAFLAADVHPTRRRIGRDRDRLGLRSSAAPTPGSTSPGAWRRPRCATTRRWRTRLELSLVTTEPAELAPVALTLQREPARSLPNLARFPIAVVTAEASMFAMFDRHLVAFLRQAGCDAELVRLADHGVHGNGHGMMLERNHEQALAVITRWVAENPRK